MCLGDELKLYPALFVIGAFLEDSEMAPYHLDEIILVQNIDVEGKKYDKGIALLLHIFLLI